MENLTKTTKSGELSETATSLMSILDARSQDIVTRRYGLKTGKVETLDSIGKEYGITRERVRQIESQAKKLLACRKELLVSVGEMLTDIFQKNGGVMTEEYLIAAVNTHSDSTTQPTSIVFFLDILPKFEKVTRYGKFGPHWSHPELHNKYTDSVVEQGEEILKKSKRPLDESNLFTDIRTAIKVEATELPDECIRALLEASKYLKKTVFGEWGITDWVETSPRGVGDKAFIVLRRSGKPMHFEEITNQINEVSFDHKTAHKQTVHNELIKDDRFVLVGRGLYGLSDWGYIPGTVADVMEAILTKAGEPMTREDLLKKVLKQRMVKKTTVLLGLQSNKRFEKVTGDMYTLKDKQLN
jgi:DNA-directed RNA polymerase delta subunit